MTALPLLDRLQALTEQATPGPWYFDGRDIFSEGWPNDDGHRLVIPLPETWHETQDVNRADAEFIAACREAVPLLIQACRAAAEVVAHGTPGPGESYLTPDTCFDALRAALAPLTGSGDA